MRCKYFGFPISKQLDAHLHPTSTTRCGRVNWNGSMHREYIILTKAVGMDRYCVSILNLYLCLCLNMYFICICKCKFSNGGPTPVHIVNSRHLMPIQHSLFSIWHLHGQIGIKPTQNICFNRKSRKSYFTNLKKRFLQINQTKRGKAICSVSWCNMIARHRVYTVQQLYVPELRSQST